MNNDRWDSRFLSVAKLISSWSKDPSTKVGTVIVGPDREIRSTGYNGFARGVADTEARLNNRELKYELIVHAEENAILNANLTGTLLRGCVVYSTWPPCTKCMRMLIQVGVRDVVNLDRPVPPRWEEDFSRSREMLLAVGGSIRSAAIQPTENEEKVRDLSKELVARADWANEVTSLVGMKPGLAAPELVLERLRDLLSTVKT